jgi:hypothetical protein
MINAGALRDELQPRVFFDLPVSLYIAEEERPLVGQAVNLSRSGVFVRTQRCLPVGAQIGFRFSLPAGEVVSGSATVIRGVLPAEWSEPTGIALRFDALSYGCEVLLDSFLARRLKPAEGPTVRLELGELGCPIRARAHSSWNNVFSVDAELPFLRIGSTVTIPLADENEPGQGNIRWVSVHVPPESGIPRINIGIELDPQEQPVQVADEALDPLLDDDWDEELWELWDEDPICTEEFAEHSRQLDQRLRDNVCDSGSSRPLGTVRGRRSPAAG